MRIRLGLVLFIFGCASPTEKKLPSAAVTPRSLDARPANAACGDSITINGGTAPDLRYAYDYDGDGNLVHATGVFTAGGPNDDITYTYDNLDRMTHMLETHGWGDTRYEITANYDSLGELVTYATNEASGTWSDAWTYAYSQFNAQGEPAREEITELNQPAFGYTLSYDGDGRLTGWTDDNGLATTYAYDDAAGTITMDTNHGAWTGTITYDADLRELSETYGGSDPNAIATDYEYSWSGDRLLGATYKQSPNNDPAQMATVEADQLDYNCVAARKLTHQRSQLGGKRLGGARSPLGIFQ
jgi:YD repeat-containing protein